MGENEYIEINGKRVKIPDIVLGKVIPPGIEKYIELEERAKRSERKADLYAIIGIIATVVCTIIGWLLGKFC